MKLSIDRQEKKGFFGGTYYESHIQLILTEEEEKIAKKMGLMSVNIFHWEASKQDQQVLLTLTNKSSSGRLSFKELTSGVTAKSMGEMDLNRLAFTEDRMRAKCKEIKVAMDNYISQKNAVGKGKYEEEF
ncbi:hypothetical protein QUB05_13240 [Microcoleus sp. F10-C6]|uniref:hypothetical protein n=1 Tax=unclassified Microcoleus TaxID=2642155 RepID=UPI002FD35014